MFSYRTLLDAASVLLAFSVLYTAFFAPPTLRASPPGPR